MKSPKRLPMRRWIRKKLDEGEYQEMKWIDREQGKFQVSWKHGSRQDWQFERDIKVFREWAIYTGKFCPEQNTESLGVLCKRWKTNFRCALNSLPEIKLMREESDGRGRNAKKVYIMKPDKASRTKARKLKESRRRMSTELAPCDREIIEIVDQMSDDMSWSPLLIQRDEDFSQLKELFEKGQIFQSYSGWQCSVPAAIVAAF